MMLQSFSPLFKKNKPFSFEGEERDKENPTKQ